MPDKDDTWFTYLSDLLTGRIFKFLEQLFDLVENFSKEIKQIKLKQKEQDIKMGTNETKLTQLNEKLHGLGDDLTDFGVAFKDLKDKFDNDEDITEEMEALFETVDGLVEKGKSLKALSSGTVQTSEEAVDHEVTNTPEVSADPFFPQPGTSNPAVEVPVEPIPNVEDVTEDLPGDVTEVPQVAETPTDAPVNTDPVNEDETPFPEPETDPTSDWEPTPQPEQSSTPQQPFEPSFNEVANEEANNDNQ